MCSFIVGFVIIFNISITFFTSLISLFSSCCFNFVSSFSSFPFLLYMYKWVVLLLEFVVLFFWPQERRRFLCIFCYSFFHGLHYHE